MSVKRAWPTSKRVGYIESPDWDADETERTLCALDDADPENCHGWADPEAPVPLCRVHLVIAWQFCRDTMSTRQSLPVEVKEIGESLIYFIRKDNLIKIGWTQNLESRMKFFRPDEILHTEPGIQQDEGALHRRFKHLKVCECVTGGGRRTREWFRPGDDLLAYIEERKRFAA